MLTTQLWWNVRCESGWVSERDRYKRCYEDDLDETHGNTTLCNQMIKSISDDKLPKQYAWENNDNRQYIWMWCSVYKMQIQTQRNSTTTRARLNNNAALQYRHVHITKNVWLGTQLHHHYDDNPQYRWW